MYGWDRGKMRDSPLDWRSPLCPQGSLPRVDQYHRCRDGEFLDKDPKILARFSSTDLCKTRVTISNWSSFVLFLKLDVYDPREVWDFWQIWEFSCVLCSLGVSLAFREIFVLRDKKEKPHILDLDVQTFICSQTQCFDDIRGFWNFRWFWEFSFVSFSLRDSYIDSFREMFVSRYKKTKGGSRRTTCPQICDFL